MVGMRVFPLQQCFDLASPFFFGAPPRCGRVPASNKETKPGRRDPRLSCTFPPNSLISVLSCLQVLRLRRSSHGMSSCPCATCSWQHVPSQLLLAHRSLPGTCIWRVSGEPDSDPSQYAVTPRGQRQARGPSAGTFHATVTFYS